MMPDKILAQLISEKNLLIAMIIMINVFHLLGL